MVTELITRTTSPVMAAAERIGITAEIRPWWGSVRRRFERKCLKCGTRVYESYPGPFWCPTCGKRLVGTETKVVRVPEVWLCPGGYNYATIHWPEVRGDLVIMWEGPCHYGNHHHEQTLTVIDEGETAFLLEVRASGGHTRFIVGLDDSHPFVSPVNRKPETLQDAFDWLVPVKVREAFALGKDVKRQGDWFFIPLDKAPIIHEGKPTKDDRLWRSRPAVYRHFLNYNVPLFYGHRTRHRGELVVYKHPLGIPYDAPIVMGKVTAPDHPSLQLGSWHLGIRNRSTPAGNRDGRGND
jgi:predicted RNA-binding Zn-ribbon protein involved in translation (DUF1610 family)